MLSQFKKFKRTHKESVSFITADLETIGSDDRSRQYRIIDGALWKSNPINSTRWNFMYNLLKTKKVHPTMIADSAELARALNELPPTSTRKKSRFCRRCSKPLDGCKYWNHCETCHAIKFRDDEGHTQSLYDPLLENRAKVSFSTRTERARNRVKYYMI